MIILPDSSAWREHENNRRRNQRPPVTGGAGAVLHYLTSCLCTFTFLSSPLFAASSFPPPLCPSVFHMTLSLPICLQAQTTLKVYNMNSDRLQKNLETAGEENTLLQESNAQVGCCTDTHTQTHTHLQWLCMAASELVLLLHGWNKSFKVLLIDMLDRLSVWTLYNSCTQNCEQYDLFSAYFVSSLPFRSLFPLVSCTVTSPLCPSLSLCSWGSRWRDGQKEWASWRRRWAGVRSPTAECCRMWPTRMSV